MVPKVGDRVEMTGIMADDPDPIPVGTQGTVNWVGPTSIVPQQFGVDWDIKRSLILLSVDPFRIVGRA